MPSSIPKASGDSSERPDFILGDRYGSACGGAIVDVVEQELLRKKQRDAMRKTIEQLRASAALELPSEEDLEKFMRP